MQTPTTAQLRTAIEVLTKLGERLNFHAEHSVTVSYTHLDVYKRQGHIPLLRVRRGLDG